MGSFSGHHRRHKPRQNPESGEVSNETRPKRCGCFRTDKLARVFPDRRDPMRVVHSLVDMFRARMFAICCGYEDADALDHLRSDPAFKLACGRLPKVDRIHRPVAIQKSGAIGANTGGAAEEFKGRRLVIRHGRPGSGEDGKTEGQPPCVPLKQDSCPTPVSVGPITRSGEPCKSAPVTGRRRCRMHGGADGSGAPTGARGNQPEAPHRGGGSVKSCRVCTERASS